MARNRSSCNGALSDILVFGYQAKLFKPSLLSSSSATGGSSSGSCSVRLVALRQSQDAADTIWLNRYDVRHHLADTRPSFLDNDDINRRPVKLDPALDDLRFGGLGDDEAEVYYMDDSERQILLDKTITHPASPEKSHRGATFRYDYDRDSNEPGAATVDQSHDSASATTDTSTKSPNPAVSSSIKLPFSLPPSIQVPSSQRIFDIIEKTARFIANQKSSEMATRVEITIQVKQASNPDFSFLNVSHPLYPFYRHILGLMQMGVYGYADNASGDEEEVEAAHAPNTPDGEENPTPIAAAASTPSTANDEQQMSPQKPAATPPRPLPTPLPRESVPVPPNFKIPTDSNLRNITDSTARSVARCGNAGSQLEFKLRLEKAANHLYQFLTPSNQFHDYYVFVRNCLRDGKIPVVPESNDNSKDDDEIKTEKRRKLQLFLAKKRSKPAPPSPPPPPALQ